MHAGEASRGSNLQDILRLLTLWFSHGAAPDVEKALEEGFQHVSIDTWLVVIPQVQLFAMQCQVCAILFKVIFHRYQHKCIPEAALGLLLCPSCTAQKIKQCCCVARRSSRASTRRRQSCAA